MATIEASRADDEAGGVDHQPFLLDIAGWPKSFHRLIR